MNFTSIQLRASCIYFSHILHGRHVIIWCNMKTMRHETYVLFTSICIFLFFCTINNLFKIFFANCCKNQMCKHSFYLCGSEASKQCSKHTNCVTLLVLLYGAFFKTFLLVIKYFPFFRFVLFLHWNFRK